MQIALTTLEEVFLNIAKQAEIENASGKNLTADVELEDGRRLPAPLGQEVVTDPTNNQTYKLTWGQDHNGDLCVTEAVLLPPMPQGQAPVQGPAVPLQAPHA